MMTKKELETIFRQNYRKMMNLASVVLGDDEAAEDVVEDIF